MRDSVRLGGRVLVLLPSVEILQTVRLVVSLSLFQLSRQGHEHATRSTAVKFVVGVVNDHFLVPSDVLVCDNNEIDDRFAAAIDQLPLAAFYKKSLDF